MLTVHTLWDTVSPELCHVSKEKLLMVKDTLDRWQPQEFCKGSSIIAVVVCYQLALGSWLGWLCWHMWQHAAGALQG